MTGPRMSRDDLFRQLAQQVSPAETSVIPPERQAEFLDWIKRNNIRDLDHPDSKYDYRGAFLDGLGTKINSVDGLPHWPDTYKMHGHPTFSVESRYSVGPHDGGSWNGETFTAPSPADTALMEKVMRSRIAVMERKKK